MSRGAATEKRQAAVGAFKVGDRVTIECRSEAGYEPHSVVKVVAADSLRITDSQGGTWENVERGYRARKPTITEETIRAVRPGDMDVVRGKVLRAKLARVDWSTVPVETVKRVLALVTPAGEGGVEQ